MRPVGHQFERSVVESGSSITKLWYELDSLPHYSARGMLVQHLKQVAINICRSPITFIATIITTSLAMFVFALLVALFGNVSQIVRQAEGGLGLSIYIAKDASATEIEKLKTTLLEDESISQVEIRDKEAALQAFRAALGDDAHILDGLEGRSPLPASLEIQFRENSGSLENKAMLAAQMRKLAFVDRVEYGQGIVSEVGAVAGVTRWGGLILIVVILLATGFIIANTVRLALYSHREEIDIMKLVGANSLFIKSPFLIEGIIEGFLGALMGLLILKLSFLAANRILLETDTTALLGIQLGFLAPSATLLILISGTMVGGLASYLVVRRLINE